MAAARVSVPVPILFTEPPTPEIAPENAAGLVLSLPMESVAFPSVTLPAPVSDPMVLLYQSRFKVAPPATVYAELGESAVIEPA